MNVSEFFLCWLGFIRFYRRTEFERVVLDRIVNDLPSEMGELVVEQMRTVRGTRRETFEVHFLRKKYPDKLRLPIDCKEWVVARLKVSNTSTGSIASVKAYTLKGFLLFLDLSPEVQVSQQLNGRWEVLSCKISLPKPDDKQLARVDQKRLQSILGRKISPAEPPLSEENFDNLIGEFQQLLNPVHLEFLRLCDGVSLPSVSLRGVGGLMFLANSKAVVVGDVHEGLLVWKDGKYRKYDFDEIEEEVYGKDLKSTLNQLEASDG